MAIDKEQEFSLAANVWAQRDLGLDLFKELKSVTHTDLEYICDNVYPFLQLVNADAVLDGESSLVFIKTSTGWTIHDYGSAISVSAPHHVDVSEDKSQDTISGKGIMAQITTVAEIAKLIAEKRWAAVELIAGTQMMRRFIWLESKKYGFILDGYAPSDDDEKCYECLVKQAKLHGLSFGHHASVRSVK